MGIVGKEEILKKDSITSVVEASNEFRLALDTFKLVESKAFSTHIGKMLVRRHNELEKAVAALCLISHQAKESESVGSISSSGISAKCAGSAISI
jgi:hypothetical protein